MSLHYQAYWDRYRAQELLRDHDEGLTITRQLALAPAGTTPQHIIDLNRFCDCAEDGQGYDVPKERMKDLRAHGLVEGGHRGVYVVSDLGSQVRLAWFTEVAACASA